MLKNKEIINTFYTTSCIKNECSFTIIENMKYQTGDIIISTSPDDKRLFRVLCYFINNDINNIFCEIQSIGNEWNDIKCINNDIIEKCTKLDNSYVRIKKLEKIINKINEKKYKCFINI